MSEHLHVRAVRPDEHERVGDLTVAAYAALPVDHMWGRYDEEIRAERDVHDFEEEHDMAFLAYTFDPSAGTRPSSPVG
jgi:hypothetical protein